MWIDGLGMARVLTRSRSLALSHLSTDIMAASVVGILALPNELLLDIAQRVNDGDFPALSLTCRRHSIQHKVQ
jgi:hypothetical protein